MYRVTAMPHVPVQSAVPCVDHLADFQIQVDCALSSLLAPSEGLSNGTGWGLGHFKSANGG